MSGAAVIKGDPLDSNSPLIYIPTGIFLFACPFLVGTRLWSRMRKGGQIGADDYTIVASLVFSLVTAGLMLAACYYGYGKHGSDLNDSDKVQALKYFVLTQVTYKASINLTKSSILLLYIRIFGGIHWFKWLCITLILIIASYCGASLLVTIFQCTPPEKAWDIHVKGSCINNGNFWYANSAFSIATDIVILLLPMPLVYALQIPRIQKSALILVFTLGIFVVITSCLRLTTLDVQAHTQDRTFDIISTMWTVIEMNMAIMCACLPQIRPVIVQLFPRLMAVSHSNDPAPRTPYDIELPVDSNTNASKNGKRHWAQAGGDGIHLTKVQKGESSSEEYILQDDNTIHKTVGYSVEYSKKPSKDTLNSLV